MEFPDNLRYTKTHEWVRVEDDGSIVMGITDYARDAMGDFARSGRKIAVGRPFHANCAVAGHRCSRYRFWPNS